MLFGFIHTVSALDLLRKLQEISFPAVFQISGGPLSLSVMGTIQGGYSQFIEVFRNQSQVFRTALRRERGRSWLKN
jgi:hypothetical protein